MHLGVLVRIGETEQETERERERNYVIEKLEMFMKYMLQGDASPDSTKYESPEDEAEEEDMAIIASKAEYKAKIENTITVEAHVAEGGCKGRSDNISFFYKATHRSFSHEERRKRQTASRL